MAQSAEAYVDTSAFIAFADRSDTWHTLFVRLFADPPKLVTSPLVVAEGHGWFLKRYDKTQAMRFLALLKEFTPLEVLPVGPPELEAAQAILRRFPDQQLTRADAFGLHTMQTRGVRVCWSTDFHLGLMGVPLAIHTRGGSLLPPGNDRGR